MRIFETLEYRSNNVMFDPKVESNGAIRQPRISKFKVLQSLPLIQTKKKMDDLHYGRFLSETEASISMRCDY